MEAGNRCFDQRVPEESNRKIVDHLSDINIVLSEHARRYLIAEGLPADRIIKSGSHMQEVLDYYMPKINDSTILSDLQLTSKKYFLVSAHREENVDSAENITDLLETLNSIATTYAMPIVVSTHPRTRMRLEKCETSHLDSHIQFLKPFSFTDYVKLQLNAKCILSDSGTITEEASLLSLPAITIRNAHERPEGMDVGTLIMSGLKAENVLDAISIICAQHSQQKEYRKRIPDYDEHIVSKKILTIVLSYIPFVNRVVWSK